jgi:aryl-alcohol dehydrogenase-like predicted oxidoreductase
MTDPTRPAQIGLGCVTFGREIDAAASHAILDFAWAQGIRLLDTAPSYGEGASEDVVGAWLETRRPASVIVSTKVTPPYTAKAVRNSLEASLQRLRRTVADVLFLHRFDSSLFDKGVLETLDQLVREGRASRLGVSNVTAPNLETLLREQLRRNLTRFTWLQNNHNFAVREFTGELRGLCAREQVDVMTYSPLAAGFLTGKHRDTVVPGTRFAVVPAHQRIYFQPQARRRLEELLVLAATHNTEPARLALSWALHQPGVSVVLVGARTVEQVEQALRAQNCGPRIFTAQDSVSGARDHPKFRS